jgi:hypothetical protein
LKQTALQHETKQPERTEADVPDEDSQPDGKAGQQDQDENIHREAARVQFGDRLRSELPGNGSSTL